MNIPVCCVSPEVSNWIPTSNVILDLNRERKRVVMEMNPSEGTFLKFLVHKQRKAQLNVEDNLMKFTEQLINGVNCQGQKDFSTGDTHGK